MKKIRLDKPNQLISVIPKNEISIIQKKCFNVFLKVAQDALKFDEEYKSKKIDEKTRYIFKVEIKEMKKQTGIDKNDYKYLKKALKELTNISVEVTDMNNENDNWRIFSLLESIKKEKGIFTFSLDWMIMKALKEHNYFTKIDLLEIAKFKSKYSVILYELAKRYYDPNNKNIKIPKLSVEKFRKITNTVNDYSRFYNLKKRVIEKACEEISEKSDIRLDYKTEKKGRSVAFIKFEVKTKDKRIKKINEFNKENKEEINKLYKLLPKIEQIESNKEVLEKLLKKYEYKYIKADIKYAKRFNPENFMGFLIDSCKKGHYGKPLIEKEEKKKRLAKEKKEEKKLRNKLQENINKQLEETAVSKSENLSDKKRQALKNKYKKLRESNKKDLNFEDKLEKVFADNHNFKQYLIKHFKSKLEI